LQTYKYVDRHRASFLVATPSIVFLFAAFCVTPMLFNMAFHVLTSALYRSYSPGVVSALLFYPVVFWYLVALFRVPDCSARRPE